SDADAKAPEILRVERRHDVLEAVVAARAPALLQLHRAGRKVQLVMDHQHLRRLDAIEMAERGDAAAALVHVGVGLEEPELVAAFVHARGPPGMLRLLRPRSALAPGDGVHPPEARVVAGAVVFPARIAPAGDEADVFHVKRPPGTRRA